MFESLRAGIMYLIGYVAISNNPKVATQFLSRTEVDPILEERGWIPAYVVAKNSRPNQQWGDSQDTTLRAVNDPEDPIEATRYLASG